MGQNQTTILYILTKRYDYLDPVNQSNDTLLFPPQSRFKAKKRSSTDSVRQRNQHLQKKTKKSAGV